MVLRALIATALTSFASSAGCNPSGFVFIKDVDSSILQDIRYYSPHNFMGRRVEGYNAPECVLSVQAAESLKKVQTDAVSLGYTLKVYDCYRPQRAVDDFVAWSNNSYDLATKEEFYPTLEKSDLFPDYIATKSGHTRGSTVDLTLVKLPVSAQDTYLPGQPLVACFESYENRYKDNSIDMGTGFDCLCPLANTNTPEIRYGDDHSNTVLLTKRFVNSESQKLNRKVLLDLMSKYSFDNYSGEWWHYTLHGEPFPETYVCGEGSE